MEGIDKAHIGRASLFFSVSSALRRLKALEVEKSSLVTIKQPLSDIFSFLTNTHTPAVLGDAQQAEQVVKTYHCKASIFQKYNLCSMQRLPWKTALWRAIKRWLELMRLALKVYANNHVINVKVNNNGGMFYQNQKTVTTKSLCSSTSKNFKIFSIPLLRKKKYLSYVDLLL